MKMEEWERTLEDCVFKVFGKKKVVDFQSVHDFNTGVAYFSFNVHYDYLLLENETGFKHGIHGVTFKVKLKAHNVLETLNVLDIYILRDCYTPSEILNYYTHSHSHTGIRPNSYETMCLGETELMNKYSTEETSIELLLNIIKKYFKTESLAGGPYIRMSQLYQQNNKTEVTDNCTLINKLLEENLSLVFVKRFFNIDVLPSFGYLKNEYNCVRKGSRISAIQYSYANVNLSYKVSGMVELSKLLKSLGAELYTHIDKNGVLLNGKTLKEKLKEKRKAELYLKEKEIDVKLFIPNDTPTKYLEINSLTLKELELVKSKATIYLADLLKKRIKDEIKRV